MRLRATAKSRRRFGGNMDPHRSSGGFIDLFGILDDGSGLKHIELFLQKVPIHILPHQEWLLCAANLVPCFTEECNNGSNNTSSNTDFNFRKSQFEVQIRFKNTQCRNTRNIEFGLGAIVGHAMYTWLSLKTTFA